MVEIIKRVPNSDTSAARKGAEVDTDDQHPVPIDAHAGSLRTW
jgi:hypothetical protein